MNEQDNRLEDLKYTVLHWVQMIVAGLVFLVMVFLWLMYPAFAQELECIEGAFYTDEAGGQQVPEDVWLESRAVRATMIGPFLNVMLDNDESHMTSIEVPVNAQTFSVCNNGEVGFGFPNEQRWEVYQLEMPWLDGEIPVSESALEIANYDKPTTTTTIEETTTSSITTTTPTTEVVTTTVPSSTTTSTERTTTTSTQPSSSTTSSTVTSTSLASTTSVSSTPTTDPATPSSTLPFTGMDRAGLTILALGSLALGLVLVGTAWYEARKMRNQTAEEEFRNPQN